MLIRIAFPAVGKRAGALFLHRAAARDQRVLKAPSPPARRIFPSRSPVWIGLGFSRHNVPSLSNTAMRALGGTKSGEAAFATRELKSTISSYAAPSFHEGRGIFVTWRPSRQSRENYFFVTGTTSIATDSV
jgi:hypothetical protein